MSRLWPALSRTLGNLSLFWPERLKRCPKGVPERAGIGSSRSRFLHQTKQRVFPQNTSGTVKSRQESVFSTHFLPWNPIQAAPLISLSRLLRKAKAGFPGKHKKSRLLPCPAKRWAPRKSKACMFAEAAKRRPKGRLSQHKCAAAGRQMRPKRASAVTLGNMSLFWPKRAGFGRLCRLPVLGASRWRGRLCRPPPPYWVSYGPPPFRGAQRKEPA